MRVSNARTRTGRRPGATRTRARLLEAARAQFGSRGFDRTSLRAIAGEAGVDQALIIHFFGSKLGLFVEAVELPIDPEVGIRHITDGPMAEIGERVANFVIGALEDQSARSVVTALVRAATSEPEAARLVRERLTHELWGPLARELRLDKAELRVALVGSQILGLVVARYVVKVEPLGSLEPHRVASFIAPALQRYLGEPL
jgi:AcrR family transcriptional regulator